MPKAGLAPYRGLISAFFEAFFGLKIAFYAVEVKHHFAQVFAIKPSAAYEIRRFAMIGNLSQSFPVNSTTATL